VRASGPVQIRDLGRAAARCSGESGELEGRSSEWLPAWLPAAQDTGHRDALVLVTSIGPSTGEGTAPCPAQTPPPNPTAAGPGDGRVLSRPSSRVHEPGTLTEAVALRSQTVLTGSGSHRYSYGGFGGGHPHFHPHTSDVLFAPTDGPLMARTVSDDPRLVGPAPAWSRLTCGYVVERVTGIEPALSAWEVHRSVPSYAVTCDGTCP
jgi:hypothetical protein